MSNGFKWQQYNKGPFEARAKVMFIQKEILLCQCSLVTEKKIKGNRQWEADFGPWCVEREPQMGVLSSYSSRQTHFS